METFHCESCGDEFEIGPPVSSRDLDSEDARRYGQASDGNPLCEGCWDSGDDCPSCGRRVASLSETMKCSECWDYAVNSDHT